MSMTKMDIACTAFADSLGLDLVGMDTLEALNAGNKAIEYLQYLVDNCALTDGYGGSSLEHHNYQLERIVELIEEWN